MSIEEIAGVLERRERDEVEMGHKLFGADYDYRDGKWYHLGIDSGQMTLEQEMALINKLMKK
jgi:cytidylate kinase